MKGVVAKMRIVLSIVAACVVLVGLPVESIAQNVKPTDYTVPVSVAEQLQLNASYKYSGKGDETLTNDANGSVFYNRYYNSLPYAWDVRLNIIGDTKRRPDGEQENSLTSLANAGIRKYFNPDGDFFYSGELGIEYQDEFDRPSIEIIPGVGYGRFIRATELARAVRIEDFLIKEGVISGHLPKETMIELAHIIEREEEFRSEYGDRYRVYWFEAMEKEIEKSGMFVGEGLGAVGVLRTQEVLFQERVNERFYGWDVRFGVRIEVLSEYEDVDVDDPSASFRARYARPLGWKSQFSVTGEFDSPFTEDFGNAYSASGVLDYLYELTNRIDFVASNIVLATKSDPDVDVEWSEQLTAGFVFFIENVISLNANANLTKVTDEDMTQGFNLSIGYRVK